MQRLKATFPDQSVASLTGDREFIGNAWIEWLQQAAIPHCLRLREDMHVFNDDHAPLPLRQHAARLRTGEPLVLKGAGAWAVQHGRCSLLASMRCASKMFAQSLQILLGLLIGNRMESLLCSKT